MKPLVGSTRVQAKMREGWHLGLSGGLHPYAWLQKGELGCGGESIDVHLSTFNAMVNQGVIKQLRYTFPTTEWVLRGPME